ncbi:MAG TPA: Ig-like domain-containing protein, partial [Anaeromyxobacteraceae bacterium]
MLNEAKEDVIRGPSRSLAGRLALCVGLLAGAMIACGRHTPGTPGSPGSPTLQSVALAPTTVTMPTGAQKQLALVGSYSDSTTAPITSGVSWSSSNPSVANLSGGGLVIATSDSTSAGTTTITASVGGLSAQASVTVTGATLQSVTVTPPSATISIPVIQTFAAIGHYSDGTTAPLVHCTWSASPESVALVDDAGFAHGVTTGGPVTITAVDNSSGLSGSATLTIAAPVLVSITVRPGVASVPVGFDRSFTVTGQYSDGTNQALTAGVTWSSSDETVASVGGTGTAHGVAQGAAVISATFGGLASTASLTVAAAPSLIVSPPAHLDGTIDASGSAHYQVSGLDPTVEYLVRVTTTDLTFDWTTLQVEVDQDASFTSMVCSSWAGGPSCRAGLPSATGDLFVLVTGLLDTPYALDVSPLPVLHAGAPPVAGSVDIVEAYYKVDGLTPSTSTTPATFTATLGDGALPLDIFAD